MSVAGRYFLPSSAASCEAVLSRTAGTLSIVTPDGRRLAECSLARINVSARLGSLHRRLALPDGGCFETADNDGIDAVLACRTSLLHRLESSWRFVIVSIGIAAVAMVWFALYGLPLLAAWLAQETPPPAVRFVSHHTLETLDGRILAPTRLAADRQRYFRARFAAMSQREPQPPYRLLLRNAPTIGPNAFALPDGSVILTDGLANMIRSNAEIDGVFAHEMAHVNHAHGLQSVYQASLVPAVIAFITGDASQAGHIAAILPGILLQSAYSRHFEQQADDDAAMMLRQQGENPAALADLLERMDHILCGQQACMPGWLSNHPATAARAARLRHAMGR